MAVLRSSDIWPQKKEQKALLPKAFLFGLALSSPPFPFVEIVPFLLSPPCFSFLSQQPQASRNCCSRKKTGGNAACGNRRWDMTGKGRSGGPITLKVVWQKHQGEEGDTSLQLSKASPSLPSTYSIHKILLTSSKLGFPWGIPIATPFVASLCLSPSIP